MKPSRLLPAAAVAVSCFFVHAAPARAQLTPEMRADMMAGQLAEALKSKDSKTIIDLIAQMRKILPELPPDLVFQEAEALLATGNLLAGKKSLDEYLRRAGRGGRFYGSAIGHYSSLKDKISENISAVIAATNKAMAAKDANITGFVDPLTQRKLVRRRYREEVVRVLYDRVHDLIQKEGDDACQVKISDNITMTLFTEFETDRRSSRSPGLDWFNTSRVHLAEISSIRQLDIFNSVDKSHQNAIVIGFGRNREFRMKFKITAERVASYSGEPHILSSDGLVILLPYPGSGKYLIGQFNRLKDLCQAMKGL